MKKAIIMAIEEKGDIYYKIHRLEYWEIIGNLYELGAWKMGWKVISPKSIDPLWYLSNKNVKRIISVEGNNLEEKIDKALIFLQNT